MKQWLIEPHDPLIVRDGRPFNATPGARSQTLPFPFPSTIAGGVRTRAGQDENGVFTAKPDDMKKIAVRGPLLAELHDSAVSAWLMPAPADALLLGSQTDKLVTRHRLQPISLPAGADSNFPDQLLPVGMVKRDPQKPLKNVPRFWYWREYQSWLMGSAQKAVRLPQLGHNGPNPERRMHVAITPETFTSKEGALFQTSGLEFRGTTEEQLSKMQRFGLVVSTEAELRTGFAPLGGERRLAYWQPTASPLPTCLPELKQKVIDSGACRLLLLTPARFAAGWRPRWLLQSQYGVNPSLVALSLRRYQVVSGWDFAMQQPKRTRRLAPAGTVFFLKLTGDKTAISDWVDHFWMQNVSDDPQDRLDGFGLATIGAWSGNPLPSLEA